MKKHSLCHILPGGSQKFINSHLYEIESALEKVKRIDGWLSFDDAVSFYLLLKIQKDFSISGTVLEIGVYRGKSAIYIAQLLDPDERFFCCDIFEGETEILNSLEIEESYPSLSRRSFEENFMENLGYLPDIFQLTSGVFWSELNDILFRMIHIDGSHLYEIVKNDLISATKFIQPSTGIIVVDDFRAQHTVGVSLAVWETIISMKLRPIVITSAKIYLVKPEFNLDLQYFSDFLGLQKIDYAIEEILGNKVIRIKNTTDINLYKNRSLIKDWIPPILVNFLQAQKSVTKFRIFLANFAKSTLRPSRKPFSAALFSKIKDRD